MFSHALLTGAALLAIVVVVQGCSSADDTGSADSNVTGSAKKSTAGAGGAEKSTASDGGLRSANGKFVAKEVIYTIDSGFDGNDKVVPRVRVFASDHTGLCDRINDGAMLNVAEEHDILSFWVNGAAPKVGKQSIDKKQAGVSFIDGKTFCSPDQTVEKGTGTPARHVTSAPPPRTRATPRTPANAT